MRVRVCWFEIDAKLFVMAFMAVLFGRTLPRPRSQIGSSRRPGGGRRVPHRPDPPLLIGSGPAGSFAQGALRPGGNADSALASRASVAPHR